MKITVSKSQWEEMGKKAGWMKTAKKVKSVVQDSENEQTITTYDDGSKTIKHFNGGHEEYDSAGKKVSQDLGEA